MEELTENDYLRISVALGNEIGVLKKRGQNTLASLLLKTMEKVDAILEEGRYVV